MPALFCHQPAAQPSVSLLLNAVPNACMKCVLRPLSENEFVREKCWVLFCSRIYFDRITDSKITIGHLLVYQRSHCLKGGECRTFWVWIDEKAALTSAVCFWSVSLVAKGCNCTVIHCHLISKIPADDSHQTDCFGKQFITIPHKSYSREQGEDKMKQKWFTEQAMSSLCCSSCLCKTEICRSILPYRTNKMKWQRHKKQSWLSGSKAYLQACIRSFSVSGGVCLLAR